MQNISKVSEITQNDVLEYIRVTEVDENDINTISTLMNVATSYIQSETGLTEFEVDNYPDFVIVVFILCQTMWDDRTFTVDNSNVNKVVETILGMHRRNLL